MVQYQYAVDSNGTPVYYRNARKGDSYYCIECGQEMILCSGEQSTYFRHKNQIDVNSYHHSTESYLHKAAKLIYAEKCKSGMLKVKMIPRCRDFYDCNFEKSGECVMEYAAREFNLMDYCEYVGTEKTVGEYRADILLKTRKEGIPVFLEVCVTHKCDDKKMKNCKVFEVVLDSEDDIDLKLPVMYVPSDKMKMDMWTVTGCDHDYTIDFFTCPNERPGNGYKYLSDLDWYVDNSIELTDNFRYNCMLCKSLKGSCNKKWDCPGFRLAYSRFYPIQHRMN